MVDRVALEQAARNIDPVAITGQFWRQVLVASLARRVGEPRVRMIGSSRLQSSNHRRRRDAEVAGQLVFGKCTVDDLHRRGG